MRSGKYYDLEQLQDSECIVKLKDNLHICTKCNHFICDDVEHLVGHCNKLGITRRPGDFGIHEER